jgi:hypothetical protein
MQSEFGQHRRGERERDDPDPITIGIGLFSAAVAGKSYLDTRARRRETEESQRAALRARWASSQRAVNQLEHAASDLDVALDEFGFRDEPFAVGAVRLELTSDERRYLLRLSRQMREAADKMERAFDDLSGSLGPDYQPTVDTVHSRIDELWAVFPEDYNSLVHAVQESIEAYRRLLNEIAQREEFL